MARKKRQDWTVRMVSFGLYEPFDKTTRALPKVTEFTTRIPVGPDVEFGYIIEVLRARGCFLRYQIDHPDSLDSRGNPAAPFTDEVRIADSTWRFFLGDAFWEPWEDKVGPWRLRCWINDECVADKTFVMEEGARG